MSSHNRENVRPGHRTQREGHEQPDPRRPQTVGRHMQQTMDSEFFFSSPGPRNFQCTERGCRAGFISRDELCDHLSSGHPFLPRSPSPPAPSHLIPRQPPPDSPHSMLRSHTPAPSAAARSSAHISRSMTPAPSSHVFPTSQFGNSATSSEPSQESLTGPGTKIPPSLTGYKIGSNAYTPLPLPPTTTHPNPHPSPYTEAGWNGTFPGPATATPRT